MSDRIVITIAKDFSKFPAGRFRRDGEFSGEAFRERHLVPAFAKFRNIVIELDGTAGYGSSFLEEAFGGLVRGRVATKEEIKGRLQCKSSDESLLAEIQEYVDDAEAPGA
jgi:hypothetical protein